MNGRVDQLRDRMAEAELDAFLISEAKNRRYLSRFTGSSGALLVTATDSYLVTDFRYFEQVPREAPAWTLWKQKTFLRDAVVELLQGLRPPRLGFEADAMTVASYRQFQQSDLERIEWVPTEGVVMGLREIKEPEEIEALRRAQAITNRAANAFPQLIEPGRSEKQVAWAVEKRLRDLGADAPAFTIIVASGPNSALPHHRPTDRVIEENEVVLVDFGAQLDGYHSDTTRTFFTGEPSEQYREIFDLVRTAQARGMAAIRPGVTLRDADAAARDVIKAAGHEEHFGHGLGHGVGLDIHELPHLSFRAEEGTVLRSGQVTTVEPGVYLPGWGGVRIEDLVAVTADGPESLTDTSKDVDAWRQGRGLT